MCSQMQLRQLQKIAKALGDVNRLKILQDMADNGGVIQCSEIGNILNLAQPSISHHIKTLTSSGLIEPEKEGRCYSYILNKTLLKEYVKHIAVFAAK
jgi:ArsR family transcriptional regulator, arsenate/arsenite/antimonite-responsive transcriptional repressor